MSDDKLTPQEWVYTGRRRGSDGKPVDVFLPLPKLDTRYPYSAGRTIRAVGGVYRVEATEDGARAHVKSARYERMHDDAVAVARWKVEHDAYQTELDLAARERRGKDLNLSALDGIREAYLHASSASERVCIEVLVLKYLRQIK